MRATALTTGAVRVAAMGTFFVVAIPGMIVSSITGHTGSAITFGVAGAFAALALIAVTAVTAPRQPDGLWREQREPSGPSGPGPEADPAGLEAAADELEAQVQALVAAGWPEPQVRDLVRDAVRVARLSSPTR